MAKHPCYSFRALTNNMTSMLLPFGEDNSTPGNFCVFPFLVSVSSGRRPGGKGGDQLILLGLLDTKNNKNIEEKLI